MGKEQFYNSVTCQVSDLKNLAGIQAALCFDTDRLRQALPEETGRKIKRVIITGCGDSYSAAGAMLPGFKLLSGLPKCNAPDIMDFCHFYPEEKIRKGFRMEEVLLVAVSFSGGSASIVDALKRAESLGAETLLITRYPESAGGQAAGHVFGVDTPEGCNTPGLRSYYASMVGLAALGAFIGLCNGTVDGERFRQVKEQIVSYTERFMEDFEVIDDQMFAEAERMKALTRFEVIADGNEGFSAQFVEEKMIECSGVYCDHTNSEEFAHISYMYRRPGDFGTIVMIQEKDPSFGRMKDTIIGALAQHRPTLIVTDADPDRFAFDPKIPDMPFEMPAIGYNSRAAAGKPAFCRIAKAPEPWMTPLVDFIPGSLLAGYHAAVNEKKYFGGRYDFRAQEWMEGQGGED